MGCVVIWREHFVGHRRRSRVHEDHALGTGLHDDVATGAGNDVEVRTNLDDVETGVRLRTAVSRLLTSDGARSPSDEERRDCEHA